MSLCALELRGVKLPDKETCLEDLTPQQIVEKIHSFHERLKEEAHLGVAPFAESYFLNLMALYPVGMCSSNMTENLKLIAALFYFGSKPTTDVKKTKEEDLKIKELFPRIAPSPVHDGYSFEDLALIFDKSKSAIIEAVKQKQEEAQIMLEEAKLRCELEKTASERLSEEEKSRLT